jgi:hypothetical protein
MFFLHGPSSPELGPFFSGNEKLGGSAHGPRRWCAEPSQSALIGIAMAGINYGNNGAF